MCLVTPAPPLAHPQPVPPLAHPPPVMPVAHPPPLSSQITSGDHASAKGGITLHVLSLVLLYFFAILSKFQLLPPNSQNKMCW
ncbi:F-box protein SKIP14-like [Gossypium australe]|uniref:F-box protein SKIP14-like n=1 Tax=Gossypium australe TaxID=47621 RepID=A0A5B6V4U5_9ROSI|nr:F-box protein SKIP14-like [Gossypium australe]